MSVHQWKCPLTSCNNEQGPLVADSAACDTEYKAHVAARHSPVEFLDLIPQTQWRVSYKLVEEKA